MSLKSLVFATNNENKVKEINALINEKYLIKSLKDINCLVDIPETANSLIGNAQLKARYVHKNYNVNCFADDTGLMVNSLNNEPGVFSARYAGPQKNSADNMSLLLSKLKDHKNRSAKFQTAICLIWEGIEHIFLGEVEGFITHEKSGKEGFGYDPIFKPKGYELTFSEMSLIEKNAISHRGRAIDQLTSFLNKI